jgi:hypothetical protein
MKVQDGKEKQIHALLVSPPPAFLGEGTPEEEIGSLEEEEQRPAWLEMERASDQLL